MLKGFWLCLKRFPKPDFVIFACVAVLVITFGKAVDNFWRDQAVQVSEKTHAMSNESLEIVICPMPRVYGLRLMHFGVFLPKFVNDLIYNGVMIPIMKKIVAKLKKKKHKLPHKLRNGIHTCLKNYKLFRTTGNIGMISKLLQRKISNPCRVGSTGRLAIRQLGTKVKKYLDNYFGTLDEMLLEEYPELLKLAWVLKNENKTIKQMLDYMSVNLTHYIDQSVLRKSVQDISGPSQNLEESVIDTRMASNCFRHVFRHNKTHGYHRSKIVYQFRKSCPTELKTTLLDELPCLDTADMYITMYITAYNQFTDVPAASVIVPYRVAADENTLLHVSAVKRIHNKKNCKTYGLNESQYTCIEDCIYENMTSDYYTQNGNSSNKKLPCTVPWIDRMKKRSNDNLNLTQCSSKKDLRTTLNTTSNMFDITLTPECSQRCPLPCEQLIITPRLTGSAYTPLNRSARIPRHPRLEVLISDLLPVFSETKQFDFGKMIAEMLGNLSFLVGVSLVALYDWLIGVVLWMFGKLPFIPAMPPVIKNELYMNEICSCAETDEQRRLSIKDTMDESETYLAASFKHRRRSSVLRSFNHHDEKGRQRRRAMTLNTFPTIAARSSAIDTVASTFPPASAVRKQSRHASVVKSQSRAESQCGEDSDVRLRSEGAPIPADSHASEQPPLTGAAKPLLQSNTAKRKQASSAAAMSEAHHSRQTPKKLSSRRVVPAKAAAAAGKAQEPQHSHGLPSSGRVVPAKAAAAVGEAQDPQHSHGLPSSGRVVPAKAAAAAGKAQEPQHSHGLPSIATARPVRDQALPNISAPGPARPKAAVAFDLDDVERILGPSASSQPGDDLGQPAADQTGADQGQDEQTGWDKAAPHYRSRPLRKSRAFKAQNDHQPDG